MARYKHRLVVFLLVCIASFSWNVASLSVLEQDGIALILSSWPALSQLPNNAWNDSSSLACAFYGVTCSLLPSNDSTVSKLMFNTALPYPMLDVWDHFPNLHTFNLISTVTGRLPPSLFNSSVIKFIAISSPGFHAGLPSNVGDAVNLETLLISSTPINGSLPDSLSTLRNLKTIAIDDTYLTGQIPSFENMTSLTTVILRNSLLSGRLPILPPQRLALLDLNNNYIRGQIPMEYSFPADRLLLSSNCLSGSVPQFSTQLKALEIEYNSLDLCESAFVWLQPSCKAGYQDNLATCSQWPSCIVGGTTCDVPSSCAPACPAPSPGPTFECIRGRWVAVVSSDLSELSVTGEVVVIGEVNIGNVHYSSFESSLLLEGCGTITGGLIFTISSKEMEAHQGKTTSNVPLRSTCPTKNITGVPITIQTPDKCRKANHSVDASDTLSLRLQVTVKDKCNPTALHWYIVSGFLGVFSTAAMIWFILWKCKCFRRGMTGLYHKLGGKSQPPTQQHELEELPQTVPKSQPIVKTKIEPKENEMGAEAPPSDRSSSISESSP